MQEEALPSPGTTSCAVSTLARVSACLPSKPASPKPCGRSCQPPEAEAFLVPAPCPVGVTCPCPVNHRCDRGTVPPRLARARPCGLAPGHILHSRRNDHTLTHRWGPRWAEQGRAHSPWGCALLKCWKCSTCAGPSTAPRDLSSDPRARRSAGRMGPPDCGALLAQHAGGARSGAEGPCGGSACR
jgi:hypothetical protein